MSNTDKVAEGARRRYEYLRSKFQGREANISQNNQLLRPEVPAILQGMPEGLIPVSALSADLQVKIPYWNTNIGPSGYADVTLSIFDSGDHVVYEDKKRFNGPKGEADFPLDQNIELGHIPHEGVFTLEYHVFTNEGTDNTSERRIITIDRTAPYYNSDPQLAFPTALTLPVTVITDDTFDGSTDFVCVLPDYPGRADGDIIVVYWGPGLPDNPNEVDAAYGPIGVPTDFKIPIPKTVIESKPNGPTFAVYWLTDKAGNLSSVSRPAEVDVQLGALPSDLKDPQVPLGPIVDLADAHLGVGVLIPAFNNPAGTVIRAQWGGTSLTEVAPGSEPRDVEVLVPWSVLDAEYSGGPGEENVQVSYQVRRGTLLFPAAPLTLDVKADFSTIGPPNPEEPNPVNPDLAQVHLTGAEGEQDKLTPTDAGQNITATVTLYDPVAPGEILKLYWGTKVESVDDFTVVDEPAGGPVDFVIPWEVIEAQANNSALPMYYTINSATGNNPQQSKPTPVDVNVLVVGFDPVSFPDIYEDDNGNKTLSCASLYSENYDDPNAKFGFRVAISGDKDLHALDTVTVVWQGYEFDGTTSIPATRFTDSRQLTQDEATNGFFFLVEPYADYILPIGQGYADVTYTVTPTGGGEPVPADPMPQKQYVSVVRPGGSTCEVPPPKP